MEKKRINPRNGGAIVVSASNYDEFNISIPTMGGNSRNPRMWDCLQSINPHNGGQ